MDPTPLVTELENVSFNISIVSLVALVSMSVSYKKFTPLCSKMGPQFLSQCKPLGPKSLFVHHVTLEFRSLSIVSGISPRGLVTHSKTNVLIEP